ncbi:hypothetical protein [Streptomyces prasinopilosus]|uniref:hypothetical protein n=1 Tax=Streptomyces prasinopilosus TaxID=67344 RepID=UPI000A941033|nr:hypothetical protein [Streptomyces prasinopilosus]
MGDVVAVAEGAHHVLVPLRGLLTAVFPRFPPAVKTTREEVTAWPAPAVHRCLHAEHS